MAEDVKKNVDPDGSKSNPNPDGSGDKKPILYDEKFVKELQTETIQRRKTIEGLEAKLKAIEDEKLSDSEKKDKKVKDLEAELENIKGSIKQKDIDILISEAVSDKNFVDIPTVKLLIKNELLSEEEITDKIIAKIVEKLIKDKPYLISSGTVNPSDGNFKKIDSNLSQDVDTLFGKMIRGK